MSSLSEPQTLTCMFPTTYLEERDKKGEDYALESRGSLSAPRKSFLRTLRSIFVAPSHHISTLPLSYLHISSSNLIFILNHQQKPPPWHLKPQESSHPPTQTHLGSPYDPVLRRPHVRSRLFLAPSLGLILNLILNMTLASVLRRTFRVCSNLKPQQRLLKSQQHLDLQKFMASSLCVRFLILHADFCRSFRLLHRVFGVFRH